MDRKDGRTRACSVRQASRGNDGYEVEKKRYCTTTTISQCSQEEGPGRPSGRTAPGRDPGHHQEAPTHLPTGANTPSMQAPAAMSQLSSFLYPPCQAPQPQDFQSRHFTVWEYPVCYPVYQARQGCPSSLSHQDLPRATYCCSGSILLVQLS